MQVDTCLGAQQMVDILTTKNLTLEDQVRELQETVDNLVSLFVIESNYFFFHSIVKGITL